MSSCDIVPGSEEPPVPADEAVVADVAAPEPAVDPEDVVELLADEADCGKVIFLFFAIPISSEFALLWSFTIIAPYSFTPGFCAFCWAILPNCTSFMPLSAACCMNICASIGDVCVEPGAAAGTPVPVSSLIDVEVCTFDPAAAVPIPVIELVDPAGGVAFDVAGGIVVPAGGAVVPIEGGVVVPVAGGVVVPVVSEPEVVDLVLEHACIAHAAIIIMAELITFFIVVVLNCTV